MNRRLLSVVAVAAFAVLVGVGVGYWLAPGQGGHAQTEAGDAERKPLYYRNAMNPSATSPVPAKDAMGMDYIPVYEDSQGSSADDAGLVLIDPVTIQSMGVRTTAAQVRTISRDIQTLGRVDFDEARIARLHSKTDGWIEQLNVDTTGQVVRKDQVLLGIYSPQLVSTQQEFLLAMNNLKTLNKSPFDHVRAGAQRLLDSSLERLQLLDVPAHQIEELKQTQEVRKLLHIHSPAEGIVISIGVREGQFITPQTELYFIADLTRVWVYVDIYEEELPWVEVGDEAQMQVDGIPGTIFRGRLTYIYPYAERRTRTIKARLEFANDDLLLKPEMYANVLIQAQPRQNATAVPSESVVRSGLREQVYVLRAPGKFEPRDVKIGVSGEGWTEILQGVDPGDEIVSSAQFLIDSESSLRESAAKMRGVDDD